MGAHVVLACRSEHRCQKAAEEVSRHAGSSAPAECATLDLTSLESCHNATRELTQRHPRIHYLINNGGSTPQYNLTREGFEDGFGGMHLGHAALTLGLLPSLAAAGTPYEPARIVMVSSEMALSSVCGFFGSEPFSESFAVGTGEGDLRGERTRGDGSTAHSLQAYGRAKLCNMLTAFELHRRCAASRRCPYVVAHALHTGAVVTRSSAEGVGDLFRGVPGLSPWVSRVLAPLLWRRPERGVRTILYAALSRDPALLGPEGQYVTAMCRPFLTQKDRDLYRAGVDDAETRTLRLPGTNKTLEIHMDRRQALLAADRKWSSRLWNVSLRLLENSPAASVVQNAP
jgi:NAD(P)-dependent dehydrogenase (short-subunit alcohol dehydrogenase family)